MVGCGHLGLHSNPLPMCRARHCAPASTLGCMRCRASPPRLCAVCYEGVAGVSKYFLPVYTNFPGPGGSLQQR